MVAVRFQCTSNEAITTYFDLLKEVMNENKLWDKPGSIYIVDETGMPLDPPKQRVCTKKGQKKVRSTGKWQQKSDNSCCMCKCFWTCYPNVRHI